MSKPSCPTTGKVQYESRRKAREALDAISVRRNGHKAERTSYPCQWCGKWHISTWADNSPRLPNIKPPTRWRYGQRTEEEE